MKSSFLSNVVVRESTFIFKGLASKDQTLLIRWDTLLVLNLGLEVFNGFAWLDVEGDCFTSQRFDENLHTTTEAENQMKRRLLLDVVVGESTSILELLASKDQTLLIRWDTLLVLNLGLDVVD